MGGPQTEVCFSPPAPLLAPYVKGYCGFRERADTPVRRRELPLAGVAVILSLEERWLLAQHEGAPLLPYRSFVGGIVDRPAISEHEGRAHALQFDLTPLGAAALFGLPGAELASRIVELVDVIGARTAELLVERLASRPTWAERFAVLDAWLLRRLAAAPRPRPDVTWAWRRIVGSAGAVPMTALLDEIGCSRRHLSSRFSEAVGVTPKRFARMVRFERAVARLRDGEEELGRIAADCGYYDQAHFNRDVREFAGVAPGALLAERHAGGFVL